MEFSKHKKVLSSPVQDSSLLSFRVGADEIAARALEDTLGASLTNSRKSFNLGKPGKCAQGFAVWTHNLFSDAAGARHGRLTGTSTALQSRQRDAKRWMLMSSKQNAPVAGGYAVSRSAPAAGGGGSHRGSASKRARSP